MISTTFIILFYIVGVLACMAYTAYEVQQDMLREGMAFNYWDCFDAVIRDPHVVFLTSWLFLLGVAFYLFFIKEAEDEDK